MAYPMTMDEEDVRNRNTTTPPPVRILPVEALPADRQMGAAPMPVEFSGRLDRAADLYGIRRAGGAPVDRDATRSYLASRMEDLSIAPARREAARQRLAMMEQADSQSSAQASMERNVRNQAAGQAAAGQAEAQGRLAVAGVNADARVTAAETAAQARLDAQKADAERRMAELDKKLAAQTKRDEMRSAMDQARREDLREWRQSRDVNSRRASVDKMLDREFTGPGGFEKKRLRQYIAETRNPDGSMKANATTDPAWENMVDDFEDRYEQAYGKLPWQGGNQAAGGGAASAAAAPSQGGPQPIQGKVRVRRKSDGKLFDVDAARVQEYINNGAELL